MLIAILLFSGITVLNIPVSTSQGIDYKVTRLEIPLYLKVMNFFDRHYSMKWLSNHITSSSQTEEGKIFALFKWTHQTIRPQPKSLPVMDDHVWNVYVRRYGVSDNFHDLFTTLSNYSNTNGFFMGIHSEEAQDEINLSFIQLEKGWVIFDPFNGTYFTNKSGNWATLQDIKNQNWKMATLQKTKLTDMYYKPFLAALSDMQDPKWKRANIQSPINRLTFQIEKWFSGKKELLE